MYTVGAYKKCVSYNEEFQSPKALVGKRAKC